MLWVMLGAAPAAPVTLGMLGRSSLLVRLPELTGLAPKSDMTVDGTPNCDTVEVPPPAPTPWLFVAVVC